MSTEGEKQIMSKLDAFENEVIRLQKEHDTNAFFSTIAIIVAMVAITITLGCLTAKENAERNGGETKRMEVTIINESEH